MATMSRERKLTGRDRFAGRRKHGYAVGSTWLAEYILP